MRNIRTTIGGAISTVGKGLIAMCVLPQLAGRHDDVLWYGALAGYTINILGEGLSKLWAADAKTVNALVEQINLNTVQIADTKNAVETKLNG